MNDTPPHITEKLCQMIRKKTPFERYLMGWSMVETSRLLMIRSIMEENPQFNATELKKEFFLRFYRDDFNAEQKEKILQHLERCSSHASIFSNKTD